MSRRVVLVCGPPGAGKSTLARTLGLTVYDIDDPQWGGSEARFRAALRELGKTPDAQAVVIRSGATNTARTKAATLTDATEIVILDTDPKTCMRRIHQRNRPRPPLRVQFAAVESWWRKYHTDTTTTPPPDPQPTPQTKW